MNIHESEGDIHRIFDDAYLFDRNFATLNSHGICVKVCQSAVCWLYLWGTSAYV